MKDCQVCGRSFDPLAFQVVVPELSRGFDRIECAHHARVTAPPGSTAAGAPLVALVEPLAAAAVIPAAAARAPVLRPAGVPLATLGLLAAGTVTAVFLWLRVLGAEPTSFPFSRGFVPPATHRESVQAHVRIVPTGTPETVSAQPEGRKPATVAVLAAAGGAFSSPTGLRRPASHSAEPTRHLLGGSEPAHGKAKGKGHPKHGKGHFMHGESDGVHSAGHGGSAATSGKHGGGKGHSKKKH